MVAELGFSNLAWELKCWQAPAREQVWKGIGFDHLYQDNNVRKFEFMK